MSPYQVFWGKKPSIDWLRTYGCKCWALIPKAVRKKGHYKSVEGIFVGYFDDSKAYKIWVPCTHMVLKSRDVIFDESNHIDRITIHATDDDDLPGLWTSDIPICVISSNVPTHNKEWTNDDALPMSSSTSTGNRNTESLPAEIEGEKHSGTEVAVKDSPLITSKDFEKGPWLDPENESYGRGK